MERKRCAEPDDDHHLIEVPTVAGPGAGAAEIGGDGRSELQEPAAQSLVGDVQAPLGEHLLSITVTQSEPGASGQLNIHLIFRPAQFM